MPVGDICLLKAGTHSQANFERAAHIATALQSRRETIKACNFIFRFQFRIIGNVVNGTGKPIKSRNMRP